MWKRAVVWLECRASAVICLWRVIFAQCPFLVQSNDLEITLLSVDDFTRFLINHWEALCITTKVEAPKVTEKPIP